MIRTWSRRQSPRTFVEDLGYLTDLPRPSFIISSGSWLFSGPRTGTWTFSESVLSLLVTREALESETKYWDEERALFGVDDQEDSRLVSLKTILKG